MTRIGFQLEPSGTPTMVCWLPKGGGGIQKFYSDRKFRITFEPKGAWTGVGKIPGPGGGGGWVTGDVYESNNPGAGQAEIWLRYDNVGNSPDPLGYKFKVEIFDGGSWSNPWDPRVIPD